MQLQQHRANFDKVRKNVRQLQQERDKRLLGATEDGDDESQFTKQELKLLQNRKQLEQAKQMGFEMEDMAKDIKFNLRSQTDKLQNSTLGNLFTMQGDLARSNRLLKLIDWERKKNKLTILGTTAFLFIALILVVYWMNS